MYSLISCSVCSPPGSGVLSKKPRSLSGVLYKSALYEGGEGILTFVTRGPFTVYRSTFSFFLFVLF